METLQDYSLALDIEVKDVIRGQPRQSIRVRGVMGDPCSQWAEAGNTVIVLFHVRDPYVKQTFPWIYVVGPPYSHRSIATALAGLPPTDTIGVVRTIDQNGSRSAFLALIFAWAFIATVVLFHVRRLRSS